MRGKIISMSATFIMMGTMVMTGEADVQDNPIEIQETIENEAKAAAIPLEIETPETGMMYARTHDVHLYTQEDADLIKRVALAEGESEGADGMWLIMSVIINRLNDPDWPDNVHDVIYARGAFSSIKDGNFAKAAVSTDAAEEAWQRIDSGDVCPQIVAFESLESNVLDKWFEEAFTFRHHKFYTKKDQ